MILAQAGAARAPSALQPATPLLSSMTAAFVFLLVASTACSRQREAVPAASGSAAVVTMELRPTATAPTIAVGNLDGQIADAAKRVERGESVFVERLVGGMLLRAQSLGTFADLDQAVAAARSAVAKAPNDAALTLVLARALAALHEFDDAEQALTAAVKLGADPQAAQGTRAAIALAVGNYPRALELTPTQDANAAGLTAYAVLRDAMGHNDEANALFEKARTAFRDVSPFTLAWLDFERARVAERHGDTSTARRWLTEAVAVLPQYAHAVVHLASYEPPADTLERLAQLDPRCDDPEVLALRATTLRRLGRNSDADSVEQAARARFEQLVAAHPRAFADHAASYYLGNGSNPARALELARINAAARPTEDALLLLSKAASAASATVDQCDARARLAALSTRLPTTQQLIDKAEAQCTTSPK